jgi:hypothetical protein
MENFVTINQPVDALLWPKHGMENMFNAHSCLTFQNNIIIGGRLVGF